MNLFNFSYSSRQVVEAIYLFEKDDPYKTKFTADEESAMLLWENVLGTTHAQEMVDIGFQQLEDNVTMSEYNGRLPWLRV